MFSPFAQYAAFGLRNGRAESAPALEFLLRDEFTTDAAAPLASPRTCEPGPGTLTKSDAGNHTSISGGRLAVAAGGTPYWRGEGVARQAGRAFHALMNCAAAPIRAGWGSSTLDQKAYEFLFNSASGLGWFLYAWGVSFQSNDKNLDYATDYRVAVVLRGTGAYFFAKGGAYTDWTLVWVDAAGTTATLYPYLAGHTSSGVGTFDALRVADLGAPFTTDYGLATSRDTAVAVNDTGAHEANALFVLENVTRPSVAQIRFLFRSPDASNGWLILIYPGGSIALHKVVAGNGGSPLASAAGFPASGARVVVVADSNVYRVYVNGTLAFTYTDATNAFLTETAWRVADLGTGGAVGEVQAWPRTISGAALTQLNLLAA